MNDKAKIGLILAGVSAGVIAKKLLTEPPGDDIHGKVVLITGGPAGLRNALAREFSEEGCRVAVCGAAEVENRHASVYRCNLADRAETDRLVTQVKQDLGNIDIVVNNCGAAPGADEFEPLMTEAFGGTANVSLALLPAFLAHNAGRIVNVTSIEADGPIVRKLACEAASAAAIAFSHALARELEGTGVQVVTASDPLPANMARAAAKIVYEARRSVVQPGGAPGSRPAWEKAVTQKLLGLIEHRLLSAPRRGRNEWLPHALKSPGASILLGLGRVAVRRLAERTA